MEVAAEYGRAQGILMASWSAWTCLAEVSISVLYDAAIRAEIINFVQLHPSLIIFDMTMAIAELSLVICFGSILLGYLCPMVF